MAVEVRVRKWGSSLGVILPKEFVEKSELKVDEKIFLNVTKKADISESFGSLKRKLSGQKFKDMVREGWPS